MKHKVVGFGEHVKFQVAMDKDDRNKFDGEWQDGYFAGVITRTAEYLLGRGYSGNTMEVYTANAARHNQSWPYTHWHRGGVHYWS